MLEVGSQRSRTVAGNVPVVEADVFSLGDGTGDGSRQPTATEQQSRSLEAVRGDRVVVATAEHVDERRKCRRKGLPLGPWKIHGKRCVAFVSAVPEDGGTRGRRYRNKDGAEETAAP